ncbi:MAG: recombination mediator RecR [Mycoplasmatales bacterium]
MKEIEKLVESLTMLQGVGEKTATRYAYEILEMNQEKRKLLLDTIQGLEQIKRCQICNCYTLDNICEYCQDKDRDTKVLLIIAYPKDINKIESILPGKYKYFVLDGVIDPLNGKRVEDLKVKELLDLIEKRQVEELILVLPTNSEGEMTAAYLKKILENYQIKFTKLAQGVPIGGSLEYLDELTLLKSIEHRQQF